LRYVQEWELDLAVAGGRHTYSGASSTTGLVIGKFYAEPEKPKMLTCFGLAQNEKSSAWSSKYDHYGSGWLSSGRLGKAS
jgi:hypothetical protein